MRLETCLVVKVRIEVGVSWLASRRPRKPYKKSPTLVARATEMYIGFLLQDRLHILLSLDAVLAVMEDVL